jgi:hypothetical protein
MAATATSALLETTARGDCEVPLWRLYVLRATYLLLVVGLGATVVPQLFDHEPTARGVIPGVLSGIWLLAFVGLRYPLQMLPLLMFEFVWKTAWTLKYGLPVWYSGAVPPTWAEDFPAIVAGVILMPIVIPWGYVWRRFVTMPADSVADGATRIRLLVMRTVYVMMLIPGFIIIGRILLNPAGMERGVFASMLTALFLLSFLVIRNPLKMLPVLLLEFVWKAIWLFAFGLPQWLAGTGSPKLGEDIWQVGLGPVFFGLLIPWGYVWRNYVRKPAERWR